MTVATVELAPQPGEATGYRVPRVINGAWQLSAGHRPDAGGRAAGRRSTAGPGAGRLVERLLRRAEAGLTTFDCADIYTGVEELLGEAIRAWAQLSESRRSGSRRSGSSRSGRPPLRVHTKLVPDLAALPRLDNGYVSRVVDRSLRRLGTDRLDLVQLHWWDYDVPGYVEAARWLDELRRRGEIAHLGATNFDAPHLAEILDAGVPLVSHQVQYSLLDRRPEGAMARLAGERGFGLLCYGALAGGFLTGRWLGAPEPEATTTALPNRSLTKYKLIQEEFGPWELFQELLATLARIAGRHGVSLSAVALRWVLDRPGVAAVIVGVGAGGDDHLAETLRVFDLELDAADREMIDAVLARSAGPAGPVYGLERVPGGHHAEIMRTDLNRVE